MSVVNFALIIVLVLLFLRVNAWNGAGELTWPSRPMTRRAGPVRRRSRRRQPRCRRVETADHRWPGRLLDRDHLPAALHRDDARGAAAAARAARPRLPATPLRLVELHHHVEPGLRDHDQPRVSLKVAAGATVVVLLVAMPGRLLHRAPPVPRPDGVPARWCWSPRCSSRPRWSSASTRSSSASAWSTAIVVADPRQRRVQPRVRDLDHQRVRRVDPGRTRGGGDGRRDQPPGRAVPGHPAARDARASSPR